MAESEAQHVDAHDVAGYIDGGLSAPDRERVAAHLADCDACRAEVAAIRGAIGTETPRYGTRWVAAGAAAALAGLVFLGSLLQTQGAGEPVLRATGESSQTIVTVEPDSVVSGDVLRFTWRSVGEEATYTVRVTGTDGVLVWSRAQLRDTTVTAPADILRPGASYFWSVEGLRADGRAFASRTRPFTLRR